VVDDLKSFKDSLLKTLVAGIGSVAGGQSSASDATDEGNDADQGEVSDDGARAGLARDLLVTLLTKAGRSKDEVIQILGREIGSALAAMLRKPLAELARNQRLQVTFEFVPKDQAPEEPGDDSGTTSAEESPRKASNKSSQRPSKSGRIRSPRS
jgi:hypothetical protein